MGPGRGSLRTMIDAWVGELSLKHGSDTGGWRPLRLEWEAVGLGGVC